MMMIGLQGTSAVLAQCGSSVQVAGARDLHCTRGGVAASYCLVAGTLMTALLASECLTD